MGLKVDGVTKAFGSLVALSDCSIEVEAPGIYGLIGPNGSGKTTLFNLVSGLLKPDSGKVFYGGRNITGRNPVTISRAGLVRTFQIPRIFPNLTVEQNLEVVGVKRAPGAKIRELLDLVNLEELRSQAAGRLSYGQKKQLDLARALLLDPELLLLDEPTAGLEPQLVRAIMDQIKYIRDMKKGVLVIEHNMNVVMNLAERIFVLQNGVKIAEGTPSEIQSHKTVVDAYLGTGGPLERP